MVRRIFCCRKKARYASNRKLARAEAIPEHEKFKNVPVKIGKLYGLAYQ
jgi:hypothetical protein